MGVLWGQLGGRKLQLGVGSHTQMYAAVTMTRLPLLLPFCFDDCVPVCCVQRQALPAWRITYALSQGGMLLGGGSGQPGQGGAGVSQQPPLSCQFAFAPAAAPGGALRVLVEHLSVEAVAELEVRGAGGRGEGGRGDRVEGGGGEGGEGQGVNTMQQRMGLVLWTAWFKSRGRAGLQAGLQAGL